MTSAHQPEPFRTTVPVRVDDFDTNGHVRGPAYLLYADHARWECVQAAGIDLAALRTHDLGPVNLETTIRFRRELTAAGSVDVSCRFLWGDGKTSRVVQQLHTGDGELVAEVESVSGLLDLATRRLVADPACYWRDNATKPWLLGL